MNWRVVVFDLERQRPGIEPQMEVALRADYAFNALGQPQGFAVFTKPYFEEKKFAFWFSEVAAPHFAEFIAANGGVVSDKPVPDDAACIGDESTRFSL